MSIEFFADYILITHTPNKLHLKNYTDSKFPVVIENKNDTTSNFIYWHIIKNRDGEPDLMIAMLDNLMYFDFEEVDDFQSYWDEFVDKGKCTRK